MVEEIAQVLEHNFDKDDLSLTIPRVFSNIVAADAKIELVTSNNLCPIKLFYSHNFMKKKKACIFVNTKLDEMKVPKSEVMCETAEQLFKCLDF